MMTSVSLPRCCVGLALRHLIRTQYRPLLENGIRYSPCLLYSTNGNKPKVLGVSSVTQQEGLEFQELPVLVRHLEKNMLPLSFTGNEAKADEHDEYIKTQLQSCQSVQDILKKLEIPTNGLTGLSAAFTLQRIWELKKASFSINAESYIEARFLDELYNMIEENISCFSNEILISLVEGYCTSESFQSKGTDFLSKEIQKRLGDFKFSVLELCVLSNMLCKSETPLNHLVKLIWVHMCHRTDIDEKNLASVFLCLPKKVSSLMKQVQKVLIRKFTQTWWHFSGKEVGYMSIALKSHRIKDWRIYELISKWMYVNINTTDVDDLMQVVSVFLSHKKDSKVLLKALEKYVLSQGVKMDLDLLALIMEYYCSNRHLSEKVFDMAAKIVITHGEKFSPLHLYSIVRQFGHFNYRSPYIDDMFKVAENVIDRKFNQFELVHIAQLLCSFVYIDRLPINFMQKIFSRSFWFRCKDTLNAADLAQIDGCLSSLHYSLKPNQRISFFVPFPTRNLVHHQRDRSNLLSKFEFLVSKIIKFKEKTSNDVEIIGMGKKKDELEGWFISLSECIKDRSHLSYGLLSFLNEKDEVFLHDDLKEIKRSIDQCGTSTKLYISHIPETLEIVELREMFEPYGKVIDSEIYKFPRGLRFAFVRFEKLDDAENAVANLHGIEYKGYTMHVQIDKVGEDHSTEEISEAIDTSRFSEENLSMEDDSKRKSRRRMKLLPNIYNKKYKKLVFLLHDEDHFCSNKGTLLGKYAKQKEELENIIPNCKVVEISHEDLNTAILYKKLRGKVSLKYRRCNDEAPSNS